jgi:transposase
MIEFRQNTHTGGKDMLKMVDKEYIRKKHLIEGWSIRKISRNLGVSRQTIRKMLQDSDIPKYNLTKAKPCPVLDPYKDIILNWLEEDKVAPKKQQHTARRIYHRLQEVYDFAGSESSVRRYISIIKKSGKEIYVPLTAGYGEQAQVDWGRAKVYIDGKYTEVSLFCLRLKASLVSFVWASPSEKMEAFLEGHKRAFEWLGGVPHTLVYDNPKTAVTKILKGPHREEHNIFSSLRAHYLFDSEFCNPAKGNEKGTVENLVKYVRQNAMVPVPRVSSLEELNEILLFWCEKQRNQRTVEWQKEYLELRPLPSVPFKCSRTYIVQSNNLLLFQHDRNHYSVPHTYGVRKLRIETYVDRIEVYDIGKLITVHDRCYNYGEKIMKLEHYLPVIATKPRASKNALVVRKLPQIYQKLRMFLCSKPEGYREFAKILLLNQEHNFEEVLSAIEESFAIKSPSLATIQCILMCKKETPKKIIPTPNLDVPVDNPSKYNHLIGGVTA